jgi:Tfp pilus assembly protein PilP
VKTRLFVLTLALTAASPALAQIPVGTRVGDAPVIPSGYDSGGRRDPFTSLLAPKRPTPGQTGTRMWTGLKSFALADVTVTGVVREGNKWTAIIENADKQSYVARPKDQLADATIKNIDSQGVVFVEAFQPGSTSRPQEVRKLLRSLAEVNR